MKLRNKKTGKVFNALIREKGGNGAYTHIVCDIKEYEPNAGIKAEKRYVLGEYHSLAELNEEWEDYKPVEPLIKDEMAREIIKKWYNKNKIVGKLQSYGGDLWLGLRGSDGDGCDWKIELHVRYNSTLKNDELYSLTELIGEEAE